VEAALAETAPEATPSAPSRNETTVTVTSCITPLVVSVLLAHRRFALVELLTIARQRSAVEVFRACSTSS
jgi:hypothetical protein